MSGQRKIPMGRAYTIAAALCLMTVGGEAGAQGLANPASQNCAARGGTLRIEQRPDGGQFGVCVFTDNYQCEEWAMFRGECPVGGLRVTGYITPAARFCATAERHGRDPRGWPLSYYRDKSFYTMRTDALDRFGTGLEQRFTRGQIEAMMRKSGLYYISFSDKPPFWCAVGYRRRV